MHNTQLRSRPDSTTIFVSLSLALLVFFAYLSATSMPSKRLLRAVVPQPPGVEAAHPQKITYPTSLKKLFVFLGADGEVLPHEEHGSSVLLDGRMLPIASPSGRSYKEELVAWLSESLGQRSTKIELTCFVENTFAGFDLVSGLEQRKRECESIGADIPRAEVQSKIRFYARTLPSRVDEILQQRSLPKGEALLLTFSN